MGSKVGPVGQNNRLGTIDSTRPVMSRTNSLKVPEFRWDHAVKIKDVFGWIVSHSTALAISVDFPTNASDHFIDIKGRLMPCVPRSAWRVISLVLSVVFMPEPKCFSRTHALWKSGVKYLDQLTAVC
jgi:hypothetical protein